MTSAYNQGRIPEFEMHDRLRKARESAGYGREQLADAMEVSRNSVYNAESGRTRPRKIMLNAWALACGVPVDWIITGKSPGSGPEPSCDLGIISPDDEVVVELSSVICPRQRPQPLSKNRAA